MRGHEVEIDVIVDQNVKKALSGGSRPISHRKSLVFMRALTCPTNAYRPASPSTVIPSTPQGAAPSLLFSPPSSTSSHAYQLSRASLQPLVESLPQPDRDMRPIGTVAFISSYYASMCKAEKNPDLM